MSDRLHNKGGGDGGRNGTQATVAWHGMAPHSYEYSNMSRGGPMRTAESQQQIDRVVIKMKVMINVGVNRVVKIILLKAY